MVILFECVVCYYVACSPWDHHSDSSVWSVEVSQVQRLNKCGQPTHALYSTQVNSKCPIQCRCVRRDNRRLACTNNTHTHCIAFCACTVPRHWYSVGVCMLSINMTLPWKSPRTCSGCAMLCLLGINTHTSLNFDPAVGLSQSLT